MKIFITGAGSAVSAPAAYLGSTHDVFLGVFGHGRELGEHVVRLLREAQFSVWYNTPPAVPDKRWTRRSTKALERSSSGVLMFGAGASAFNLDDLLLAALRERVERSLGEFPVIPFLLPDAPEYLRRATNFDDICGFTTRPPVQFEEGPGEQESLRRLILGIRRADAEPATLWGRKAAGPALRQRAENALNVDWPRLISAASGPVASLVAHEYNVPADGRDAANAMRRPAESKELADALAALAAAARVGFSHHALKPENVIVGRDGLRPRDFGPAPRDEHAAAKRHELIATRPRTDTVGGAPFSPPTVDVRGRDIYRLPDGRELHDVPTKTSAPHRWSSRHGDFYAMSNGVINLTPDVCADPPLSPDGSSPYLEIDFILSLMSPLRTAASEEGRAQRDGSVHRQIHAGLGPGKTTPGNFVSGLRRREPVDADLIRGILDSQPMPELLNSLRLGPGADAAAAAWLSQWAATLGDLERFLSPFAFGGDGRLTPAPPYMVLDSEVRLFAEWRDAARPRWRLLYDFAAEADEPGEVITVRHALCHCFAGAGALADAGYASALCLLDGADAVVGRRDSTPGCLGPREEEPEPSDASGVAADTGARVDGAGWPHGFSIIWLALQPPA
jgi:hypothetical protein